MSNIPYGYKIDPNNHEQLIIDDEPAEIVKRIFEMILNGFGISKIAEILRNEKIVSPKAYISARQDTMPPKIYKWYGSIVSDIIANEKYIEEIVNRGTWELAQKLRKTRRKYSERNRLTGLVYCVKCGSKMTSFNDGYICSKYRNNTADCSMHFIRTEAIEQLILNTMRKCVAHVKNYREEALQKILDICRRDKEIDEEKFNKLVDRYIDFNEITTPDLYEYVYKIVVHEREKESGSLIQKVDVHLNFIIE